MAKPGPEGAPFAHQLIATEEALDVVVSEIDDYISSRQDGQQRAYLYLDCEGRELGRAPEGKLGLLQVGLSYSLGKQTLTIYLIDVVTIRHGEPLARFFALLSSPSIVKVLWDAKMDYSELLHGHGITLEPVLDLQVVELIRRRANEKEERGKTFCYKLLGLRTAVDRFAPFSGARAAEARRIDEVVKPIMRQGQSRVWLERPLSMDLCLYAALDVVSLAAMHAELVSLLVETEHTNGASRTYEEDHLLTLSDRYASLYRAARPRRNDIYTRHGFLPMGFLDDIHDEGDETFVCDGCRRSIPATYWHRVALKRIKSGHTALCPVCAWVKAINSR